MSNTANVCVDPVEVIRWYREHPNYEKQIIDLANQMFSAVSCSSIDELVEEFTFLSHEGVGFIPDFAIDELGCGYPTEEILWEESNYDTDRSWTIYKVLWFIVSVFRDSEDSSRESEVLPAEKLEEILKRMKALVDEDRAEATEFIYGPESHFLEVDKSVLASLNSAEVLSTRDETGSISAHGSNDHSVQLLRNSSGSYLVLTVHFGEPSKYCIVESEDEGRDIIERFW
jgi:hypothetical protein